MAIQLPLDDGSPSGRQRSPKTQRNILAAGIPALLVVLLIASYRHYNPSADLSPSELAQYQYNVARCGDIYTKPGPSKKFYERTESDRFEKGTGDVYIRNATLWTGGEGGKEVVRGGNVCLSGGLIKGIGSGNGKEDSAGKCGKDAKVIDAHGAWLTPGIIDMHSHITMGGQLAGQEDGNAQQKIAVHPWFRAIDAIHTDEPSLVRTVAGGTTSALLLPGSAHAINGEGIAIKLRPTRERTPDSMVLEREYLGRDGKVRGTKSGKGWRYMKSACGENPMRVLDLARPETVHEYRLAFHKARTIKRAQDGFCSKLKEGYAATSTPERAVGRLRKDGFEATEEFPGDSDSTWDIETIVSLLHGNVKAMTHCYTTLDFNSFLRLSHEFEFEVEAFHHAHEAYVIPELLNSSYGKPPAVAIFSLFANYKAESYKSSPYAPAVLERAGIDVVIKSDHPGVDSRYMNLQAGQAHHLGMSLEGAMNSITTAPARRLGLDHRIGYLKEGYDADVVLWDSHPLNIGATPIQVIIDGIAQVPHQPAKKSLKPHKQAAPASGDYEWHIEQAQTLSRESGELSGIKEVVQDTSVTYVNVSTVYGRKDHGRIEILHQRSQPHAMSDIVMERGEIVCTGACTAKGKIIDLHGGTITPGLISVGSQLGLEHIMMESTTVAGSAADVDFKSGEIKQIDKAADSLLLHSRDMINAREAGITRAVSTLGGGFLQGLSANIGTGSMHSRETNGLLDESVALHMTIAHGGEQSVAQQVLFLQKALLNGVRQSIDEDDISAVDGPEAVFSKVALGRIPLAIAVSNADIMARLIDLKQRVEKAGGQPRIIFLGAHEGHLLAKDIADASISVVIPSNLYPSSWEARRLLIGKPLTKTLLQSLVEAGVQVAMGPPTGMDSAPSNWRSVELMQQLAWAYEDADGLVTKAEAIAMLSSRLEAMMGLKEAPEEEYVAWEGDPFEFGAKVRAIGVPGKGVEIFH